jgi:hypothetical protein
MHYYPSIDTVRVFDARDQTEAMDKYPFHFRGNNAVIGPLNADGDPEWIDFKR